MKILINFVREFALIHICILCFFVSVTNGNDEAPNVLILLMDDWGWGDLGVNIEKDARKDSYTPFMDSFANSNMRFTDFHSASAMCTPSRAALLTGRLGLRTGTTMIFEPSSLGGLPKTEILLSSFFKQKNYTTFAIGKWHLGHHGDYHPSKRDFDHYFGVPYALSQGCFNEFSGYAAHMMKPCNETKSYPLGLPLYRNEEIIEQPLDLRQLSNNVNNEFKERILEIKKKNAKFFGYIPFSHVHTPLGYDKRYDHATDSIFGNTVRELDDSVRSMIDTLKETGLYENTLIWLFGDNGPWEKECQYAGSPGPFQGIWQKTIGGGGSSWKGTSWEGGHRVPGIVSWPRVIKEGRVSEALINALDIVPTLSNLVGFDLPKDRKFDGVDVSDVLVNNSSGVNEVLYHPRSNGYTGDITAMRYKNYKAIYESGGDRFGGCHTSPVKKTQNDRPLVLRFPMDPAEEYLMDTCDSFGGCHTKPAPTIHHDPPLLFDLSIDPAEENPLDTRSEKYKKIVDQMNMYRKLKLLDIESDFKSVVDLRESESAYPCCNKQEIFCRCLS